ncbi:MAG: hypothetical protein J6C50_03895, partial [Rickettsiales bacterium]|nr:hypothetical protein [Rickettsiales bacterium]
SVDALTANSSLLGNNTTSVIEMVLCNDETCSNIDSSNVIDITLEDNKSKTYDYNTYITIDTCNTGYSLNTEETGSKRVIRCNENSEWEVKEGTENNMCVFTGCNDMSAVFDKNGNMVSEQLYKMQFAINTTCMYPILACKDATNNGSAQDLSINNNFIVNINTKAYCGESTGSAVEESGNRVYTCTEDTTNINNGNSYWKANYASCDLDEINNKGYTVYLANDKAEQFTNVNSSTLTIDTKTIQKRVLNSGTESNGSVYTSQYNDFRLFCNSSGNWEMTKTANSCSGVPTLVTGGKFYKSDEEIKIISGTIFNTSNKSKVSTLTKTILENAITVNGTKIDVYCNKYTEFDSNNIGANTVFVGKSFTSPGYHYACENGTWKRYGGCGLAFGIYVSTVACAGIAHGTNTFNWLKDRDLIKYFTPNTTAYCSNEQFGVDISPNNKKYCTQFYEDGSPTGCLEENKSASMVTTHNGKNLK